MAGQEPFSPNDDPPPIAQPVPPIVPQPPPERTSWPTVLGVICIVFGSLVALCGACNIGQMILPRSTPSTTPPAPVASMPVTSMPAGWPVPIEPWTSILVLVIWILAIALLTGGIGLILRQAWAVRTLKIWAPLKLLATIGHTILAVMAMSQGAAYFRSLAPAGAIRPEMVGEMQCWATCGGVAWGAALPLIILLWFSQRSVKAEVAHWH